MSYVDEGTVKWLVASVHYLHEQLEQLKNNGHAAEVGAESLVPQGFQIEHYSPTLLSSFNGGLGTQHTRALLADAINRVSDSKLSRYDRTAAMYLLQRYVSGKDTNLVLGRLREYLKKRMEEIFGFDGSSDKDQEFSDMNQLGYLVIKMQKELKTKKVQPSKIVDALLSVVYGWRVQDILESPEKILVCPRCKVDRSFVKDRKEGHVLCLSCGHGLPEKEAVFKIRVHKIDRAYLMTVKRLLANPAK